MESSEYLSLMRRLGIVLNAMTPGRMPLLLDGLTAHADRSMAFVEPRYLLNEEWRAFARGEVSTPGGRLCEAAAEYRTTPAEMAVRWRERGGEQLGDYRSTVAIYESQVLAVGSTRGRQAVYCTEEMSALVRSAAVDQVAESAVTVADLPSESGVAYLYDRFDPLFLRWTATAGGRLFANLATPAGIRRLLEDRFSDAANHVAQPFQFTTLSEPFSDLPPEPATIVTPFDDALSDSSIRATGALNTLFALSHLARQARLASVEVRAVKSRGPSDLKGRRRSRTDEISYLSYAPRSSGVGGGSGRAYSHRWVVRGHWRRQWYPSQSRHVPIYIAEHIAGPEDLPIGHRDRVTVARPGVEATEANGARGLGGVPPVG